MERLIIMMNLRHCHTRLTLFSSITGDICLKISFLFFTDNLM
jgi:hypothetical protein